jgi:hypothetical protein
MTTSVDIQNFRKKIDQLVHEMKEKREEQYEKPEEPMLHYYHEAYKSAAKKILKELIEPRIDAIAESFDNASMQVSADVDYIRLSFSTKEKRSLIYVLFCLLHDHSERKIKVYAESCLWPFSKECQPSASVTVDLDSINYDEIGIFVEGVILSFLRSYLLNVSQTGIKK